MYPTALLEACKFWKDMEYPAGAAEAPLAAEEYAGLARKFSGVSDADGSCAHLLLSRLRCGRGAANALPASRAQIR